MPLISRILFTIASVFLPIGAHVADFFSDTHIFNPRWTPHAKFHGGQTLMFSIFLGVLTIWFAWRKTSDKTTLVFATASLSALYWVTQALAGVYPGAAAVDPEFVTPNTYHFGLPPQSFVQIVFLVVTGVAAFSALRRGARWVPAVLAPC